MPIAVVGLGAHGCRSGGGWAAERWPLFQYILGAFHQLGTLLDQVAYACASRYAGRYVVTLTVDQVTFLQPVHVGELVTFLAAVNHTGRSSMEVGIKVIAEAIQTRVVRHVNSCFFTMVAVGDDRKPVAVTPLQPATPEEHRRWAAAITRKDMRRELAQRFAAIQSGKP